MISWFFANKLIRSNTSCKKMPHYRCRVWFEPFQMLIFPVQDKTNQNTPLVTPQRFCLLLLFCSHASHQSSSNKPGTYCTAAAETQGRIWRLIWLLQWLSLHQTGSNCEVDVRRQAETGVWGGGEHKEFDNRPSWKEEVQDRTWWSAGS